MIYWLGLIIMLIGLKIAMTDVENSNLPEGTPVVMIGTIFMLIGYLLVSAHNISKTLQQELFPPAKVESVFSERD